MLFGLDFERRLMLQFRGAFTSDAGLLHTANSTTHSA